VELCTELFYAIIPTCYIFHVLLNLVMLGEKINIGNTILTMIQNNHSHLKEAGVN